MLFMHSMSQENISALAVMDYSELQGIHVITWKDFNKTSKNSLSAFTPTDMTLAPRCSWAGSAQPFTPPVVSSICGRCAGHSVEEKRREYRRGLFLF